MCLQLTWINAQLNSGKSTVNLNLSEFNCEFYLPHSSKEAKILRLEIIEKDRICDASAEKTTPRLSGLPFIFVSSPLWVRVGQHAWILDKSDNALCSIL